MFARILWLIFTNLFCYVHEYEQFFFGDGLKSKHTMVIIHDIEMTAHELLLYTLHRLDGWLMSFCVAPASNCSTSLGCSELLLDSKMTNQAFAICSSLFALRSSLFALWFLAIFISSLFILRPAPPRCTPVEQKMFAHFPLVDKVYRPAAWFLVRYFRCNISINIRQKQ